MADERKSVNARLAAKGYQEPDLRGGAVDTSGRVSPRSSYFQAISLCAIEKWKLWSLDIEDAFLQADGFTRVVFLQPPSEWAPLRSDRAWELKAPAYGLNDAPVVSRSSLEQHELNSDAPSEGAGLRCRVSTFGACLP